MSESKKRKCICCGMGLIEHRYDICEICGWQDDPVQNKDPEFAGGSNSKCLNQYREDFQNSIGMEYCAE